jgi:hypothetical protein
MPVAKIAIMVAIVSESEPVAWLTSTAATIPRIGTTVTPRAQRQT